MKLYTLGHSSRTLQEFIALLHAHNIQHIVDVRSSPHSEKFPWFDTVALKNSLAEENITYTHLKELGGLRSPHKDSINKGWKHSGFRGYADYMLTPEFENAVQSFNKGLLRAGVDKVAIMCAEAVPWHCHRSLLSDAETFRGIEVFHITSAGSTKLHNMTSFAKIKKHKNQIFLYYS